MRVTAETKNATRQRILDAAKRQFAQQGFDATTTRDIAGEAEIAVGTLFNYFPTKESIVEYLVGDAYARAAEAFAGELSGAPAPQSKSDRDASQADEPLSLEEELFAHVAVILRKLKPYRKYLPAVLETTLSPLANPTTGPDQPSLRAAHLETMCRIASRHDQHEQLSPVAIQLYWTLYTGVLAFWASDRSPRQEDTLALLDQSLAMFVGWLNAQANDSEMNPK
ncbi:MAG: TetR/AcrR family transcriptional regulator [Pirellulales bacterium]